MNTEKNTKPGKTEKHVLFVMISAFAFLISVLITTYYCHFTEAGVMAWNLLRYRG